MLARLGSNDDGQFRGAFLEVYLHEMFVRAGWAFTRHPTLKGTTRRPDFLVDAPTGRCIVEATTTNPSSARGDEQRYNAMIDKINQLPFGNFFLDVTVEAVGPADIRSRQLLQELTQWLETLDPDQVQPPAYPELSITRRGWSLEFVALPASPEWRGAPGRIVGLSMNGASDRPIVDDDSLRKALAGKAHRYGRPELPYVVAVDEIPWSPNDTAEHRKDALFGSTALITSGDQSGQWTRAPDGVWRRGRTWRSTGLSAVLLLSHLHPWSAFEAVPELWVNPRATHPNVPVLPYWAVHRVVEENGQGHLAVDPPSLAAPVFWGQQSTSDPRRQPTPAQD